MPNNHFGFRIRKDIDNYYAVISGLVTLIPKPSDLSIETICDISGPKNWNEEGIRWERHPVYHGITTSYSESLQFVADGAQIIKYVYSTFDIEAPLQLEVWAIQNYNESWLWSPYFVGDIDLSTYDPDVENGFIKVNIKDGGANAIIKAGENIKFEIDMPINDTTYINQDGIKLQATYNWLLPSSNVVFQTDIPKDRTKTFFAQALPGDDGGYPVVSQNSTTNIPIMTNPESGTNLDTPEAFNNYLLATYQEIDGITIKLTQSVEINSAGGSEPSRIVKVDLAFIPVDNSSFSYRTNIYSQSIPNIAVYNLDINILTSSIPVPTQQNVYLLFYIEATSVGASVFFVPEGKLSIDMIFRLPQTVTRGMRYYKLGERIVSALTDNAYQFKSDWLTNPLTKYIDTYPYNWVVFPGDSARNLINPKMAISLADYMKDGLSSAMLGLGVEGQYIRIEPLMHFYADFEICRFKNVKNFRAIPDLQIRANQLAIGMEDQTYDTLNGKNEPNAKQTYSMPFTRVSNILDLVSPIRSDYTGIEQVRSIYGPKQTTDNKGDQEVFKVSINNDFYVSSGFDGPLVPVGAEVYSLYRPQIVVTGLMFQDTAYNLDLQPKYNFFRCAPLIQAYNYKRDDEKIIFRTQQNNQDLQSDLGDGFIIQKADVTLPINEAINGLITRPLFQPISLLFETTVPQNFNEIMAANPYGYITVEEEDGTEYKGCIMSLANISAEDRSTEIILRAHPDNVYSAT